MTARHKLADVIVQVLDCDRMWPDAQETALAVADAVLGMGYVPAADVEAAVRKEREACANVSEDYKVGAARAAKMAAGDSYSIRVGVASYEKCAQNIADAIRARTTQENET